MGHPREQGGPTRALLLLNLQNDFVDGSVQVPGARAVVDTCNSLRGLDFDHVYLFKTVHAINHCSFRNNHPGSNLYEVLYLTSSGDSQKMWPDYCVEGTAGAELHPSLTTEPNDIIICSGRDPTHDMYSAFKDNGNGELTDLGHSLTNNRVDELYLAGLPTEYAIQYTVQDCRLFLSSVKVFVIPQACCGFNANAVQRTLATFEGEENVFVIGLEGPELRKVGERALTAAATTTEAGGDGIRWALTRSPRHQFCQNLASVNPLVDSLYEAILTGAGQSVVQPLVQSVFAAHAVDVHCSWSCKNALHACALACDVASLDLLVAESEKTNRPVDWLARAEGGENAAMLALVHCRQKRARLKFLRKYFAQLSNEAKLVAVAHTSGRERLNLLMLACKDIDIDAVELILGVNDSFDYLRTSSRFGTTALMLASSVDSAEAAALVEALLVTQPPGTARQKLLQQYDADKWNSVHLAARSGSFAKINWARAVGGRQYLSDLPLKAVTAVGSGFSVLQLAVWNGNDQVVRAIIDLPAAASSLVPVNRLVHCSSEHPGDSELDIAIKRQHLKCVRLLLRLGARANSCEGLQMQVFLHRLVLMGDLASCEAVLDRTDENGVVIDDALVLITQRMENPETCTLSFANATHPAKQFLVLCNICQRYVCLVCKEKCHGARKGQCRESFSKQDAQHFPHKDWAEPKLMVHFCECAQNNCCNGVVGLNVREKNARLFRPEPIETTGVSLNTSLIRLARTLARNAHNVWALEKHRHAWTYSKTRDDTRKHHPLLLTFDALPPEAKGYNIDVAVEAVKVIIALGYDLSLRTGHKESVARAGKAAQAPAGELGSSTLFAATRDAWHPDNADCQPFPTSAQRLPVSLNDLIECIARNSHEVWAKDKMEKGWRYAPAEKIQPGLLLTNNLVPYKMLGDAEKSSLKSAAIETIKAVLHNGWDIIKRRKPSFSSARALGAESAPAVDMRRLSQSRRDIGQSLAKARRQFFDQYLFSVARRGSLKSLDILISTHSRRRERSNKSGVAGESETAWENTGGVNLNAQDSYGQTPLYIAVKRGHKAMVRRLLSLHVRVDTKDHNGITPLAIAAYLGNVELCRELLSHDANIILADKMGFTALHHASYKGHVNVCRLLITSLKNMHQSDAIVNLNAVLRWIQQRGGVTASGGGSVGGSASPKEKLRLLATSKSQLAIFKRQTQKSAQIFPANDASGKKVGQPEAELRGGSTKQEDLNIPTNICRYSPLSMAVASNQNQVLELLLELGADPMFGDGSPDEGSQICPPYIRALRKRMVIESRLEDIKEKVANLVTERYLKIRRASIDSMPSSTHSKASSSFSGLSVFKFRPFARLRSSMVTSDLQARGVRQSIRQLNEKLIEETREYEDASKTIEYLNASMQARKWRNRLARFQFIKEMLYFVVLMLILSWFLHLNPSYDNRSELAWKQHLSAKLADATQEVATAQGLLNWTSQTLFAEHMRFNQATGRLLIFNYNYVFGAIEIVKTDHSWLGAGDYLGAARAPPLVSDSQVVIMLAPPEEMASALHAAQVSTTSAQHIELIVNVYNPFYQVYGVIRVSVDTLFYADPVVKIHVDQCRLHYAHFPPSREFQFAVLAFLASFAYPALRAYRTKAKTLRSLFEYKSITLFLPLLFLLILDLYIYERFNHIAFENGQHEAGLPVDLPALQAWLAFERQFMGIVIFLSMLPLLYACRTLPSAGPVIVALLNTIASNTVATYLAVLAAAFVPIAMSLHQAFGAEVYSFRSLDTTYSNNFLTPFIETWEGAQGAYDTSSQGIFLAVLYILFAIITSNLLIAVVTDVYPREREKSGSLWEELITNAIETQIRVSEQTKRDWLSERIHKRFWDCFVSDDLNSFDGGEISYWTPREILTGKDGIKHWGGHAEKSKPAERLLDYHAGAVSPGAYSVVREPDLGSLLHVHATSTRDAEPTSIRTPVSPLSPLSVQVSSSVRHGGEAPTGEEIGKKLASLENKLDLLFLSSNAISSANVRACEPLPSAEGKDA